MPDDGAGGAALVFADDEAVDDGNDGYASWLLGRVAELRELLR
jgi:hypothetical protein